MTLDGGLDPKTLASQFGAFVENSRTIGGSYKVTTGKDYFIYQIGQYSIEGIFINGNKCRVKATNGLSIEETWEIPYIGNTPNYNELFRMSCGLAKKLADSKQSIVRNIEHFQPNTRI